MNKLFKSSLSFTILFFTLQTYAQTGNFEGTVEYSMDIDMKNMPPEAAAMMKSSSMVTKIKNEHSRTETKTPMSSTISITNNKEHTGFTLLDMMGAKYMIKLKPEEIKKDQARPDVKVKELAETKTIAGYKCKKAEITVADPETKREYTTTVFYTADIPYDKGYGNNFKGLKGFPLEYSISPDAGTQMKFTAVSVTKEKLDDTIFAVPTGYKETTTEDLQKEMMKNFGGGGQ